MDIIGQIKTEGEAKGLITSLYPAERVNSEFERLIERKRVNALRTAETVLIILKEFERNGK